MPPKEAPQRVGMSLNKLGCMQGADGPVVSALDCQIYDRGTIPAPNFPFRVDLPVHPAVNGYRNLPWKLNAAERSADHIASHVPISGNGGPLTPTAAIMSTWTCSSGAATFA